MMRIKELKIENWDGLMKLQRPYAIYRGQAEYEWGLSTSIERACLANDNCLDFADTREKRLILSFKRHYHEYSNLTPSENDELRWLALMQHYGAPTRLMDWSYSIAVALYFAIEHSDSDCAIWEIDTAWLNNTCSNYLKGKGVPETTLSVHLGSVGLNKAIDRFAETYLSNNYQCVRVLTPYFRDKRLMAQQGMFACPGDVSLPFMENLENMSNYQEGLIKYLIPNRLRKHFLYQLYSTNISRFTLFPGLDGYAQTLKVYHPLVWDMELPTGKTESAGKCEDESCAT